MQQNTQQMTMIPRPLAARQASAVESVLLRRFAPARPSLPCPTPIGHPVSLVFSFVKTRDDTQGRPLQDRGAGACGRGCAPVPQILCGGEDCLSEASSAAQATGTGAKAPPGATPGRQWFWVLLPKQKDLVVRGRNPHEKDKTLASRLKMSGMTKGVVEDNRRGHREYQKDWQG